MRAWMPSTSLGIQAYAEPRLGRRLKEAVPADRRGFVNELCHPGVDKIVEMLKYLEGRRC